MKQFKEKLYEEFEANSFKLLGAPGNRVREVLSDKGEDIDAEFEAAWDFSGTASRPHHFLIPRTVVR